MGNTGTISRKVWVTSLIKICGDDLPWEEATKCWIAETTATVDYRKFLDQFRVVLSQERWCGWKSLVIQDVYQELLNRNVAAQDLLKALDPSGDGIVCVDDFMTLMTEYSGGCLSEPQIKALSRTIFAHAYGRGLRVSTFLARFSLAFVQSKGMSSVDRQCPISSIGPTMEQIGKLIVLSRSSQTDGQPSLERNLSHGPLSATLGSIGMLPPPPMPPLERGKTDAPMPLELTREQSLGLVQTFEGFNDSGLGLLHVEEFVQHILALPGISSVRHEGKPLDETALRSIAQSLADADGTINLLQFAQAFAAVDAGSADLADDLHEHILTFLYRHRDTLRSNCARHDKYCTGRITKRNFARVLEAVNFCTAKPARNLTRVQMSVLAESLAEDEPDGTATVEYEAFLSSFEVQTGW